MDNFSETFTSAETKLFLDVIEKSKVYLEFGSGASTKRALENSSATIYSVESDICWYNNMMERLPDPRVHLLYVNIGPTIAWGWPTLDGVCKIKYPDYSAAVFNHMEEKPDTVLIDGRFRVACALQTIRRCLNRPIIMIHDFSNRPEYAILTNYLECKYMLDTLAVFEVRKDVDMKKVMNDYTTYRYDPR